MNVLMAADVHSKPANPQNEDMDSDYASLAKEMQDDGIDPDDINIAIKAIKDMRKSKAAEMLELS